MKNKFMQFLLDMGLTLYSFYLFHKRGGGRIKYFTEMFTKENNLDDKYSDSNPFISIGNFKGNLSCFEISNKKMILDRYEKFDCGKRAYMFFKTSGTTGQGLKFPVSRNFVALQWAIFEKQWQEFGLNGKWRFQFSGFKKFSSGEVAQIDYYGKKVFLSQYDLSSKNINKYINVIERMEIDWIHGYPSSIFELFKLLECHGRRDLINSFSFISVSSETLLESHISFLKGYPNIKIINLYGQTEGVANFFTCRKGYMHVNENFSHVEFIKDDGVYKIIGTQPHNKAFSFVRYDTGDSVEKVLYGYCECGRSSRRVINLQGRIEDSLILKNGSSVGRLDHLTKGMYLIENSQIVQKEKGAACFYIVAKKEHHEIISNAILKNVENFLGGDFIMRIKFVESIGKQPNGKIKHVISEIE